MGRARQNANDRKQAGKENKTSSTQRSEEAVDQKRIGHGIAAHAQQDLLWRDRSGNLCSQEEKHRVACQGDGSQTDKWKCQTEEGLRRVSWQHPRRGDLKLVG